jgi:hypothetical protein
MRYAELDSRVMRLTIVLLLALEAPTLPAAAQSEPRLRDYLHTAWTHHDGMPLGRVTTKRTSGAHRRHAHGRRLCGSGTVVSLVVPGLGAFRTGRRNRA